MKSTDLKNKTSKELEGSLSDLKIKLAKISFELEAHALKDTSQIKKIKKDIALILTLLKSQNSQTLNPKL